MRWWREPLVHFAVLGVAVFGLQQAVGPGDPTREVVVTDAVRRTLDAEHARQYGAPPTAEQHRALVERWIDDEVRVREALALGLDRGDIIVRRRLIQKMDFLLEDETPVPRPSDATLAEFLAAHADRYALPARVSIEHVFAASDRSGGDATARIAAWREQLRAGASAESLGDPFLRGRRFPSHTEQDLAGVFGAEFARAVMALPLQEWSPPLRSTFGTHTVRVTERTDGRAARLADVRAAVERDWRDAQRAVADRSALQALRSRYVVRHEPLGDVPSGPERP